MEEGGEKVAWNLSQQLIFQIGALLQQGSYSFTSGYTSKCFWCFREIRILIYADLSPQQLKKVKDLEQKIGSLIVKDNNNIKINNYLSQYREYVMELLAEKGYLISKKQDSSRMF